MSRDKKLDNKEAKLLYGAGRSSIHFKLREYGSKFWFHVLIYDDIRVLRKDIDSYNLILGYDPEEVKLFGVHHPYQRFKVGPKGGMTTEYSQYDIGIIRLAKKHLSIGLVAHEVIHAATHQFRCENKGAANLGQNCADPEEDFAYLYGGLIRDMNLKLYKHGLWK